jgi:sugar/nucleoside kinase (ribokinase family)
VKVSAADLEWLAPERSSDAAAADLLAHGPAAVVLTRGRQGARLLQTNGEWSATAFPVRVVDTVGAGDAFDAGLLAAPWERGVASRAALLALGGGEIVDALRFAHAVAALTCARTRRVAKRWKRFSVETVETQLYSSGLISGASMLVLSYQWKPVSMFLGNCSPLIALTAASTDL